MIIDAHNHFTTAPAQLQAYRGQQISNLAKPVRAKLADQRRRIGAVHGRAVQTHGRETASTGCCFRRRPGRWGITSARRW